jgi:hypothetical protein
MTLGFVVVMTESLLAFRVPLLGRCARAHPRLLKTSSLDASCC